MILIRNTVIWATLALALFACSASPEQGMTLEEKLEARNYVIGEPVSRISGFRINGWSELDDYHLIVSAGVRDDYLVNLRHRCMDLSMAMSIAFTSTAGTFTPGDRLMVKGPGGTVTHCYILSFTRLYRNLDKSSDS